MKRLILTILMTIFVTSIASAQGDDNGDFIRSVAQSVVLIGIVEDGEIVGNGSGTLVDPSGVIYTNRHVVEDSDELIIFVLDDIAELPEPRYLATPVFISDVLDFAVIQIDRDAEGRAIDPSTLNLPFLSAAPGIVNIGDQVRVFGYPGIGDGYMVVTSGEIVNIQNGTVNGERVPVWYRTDTEFSGGNSGGLAINERGEFIGLPTWVRTEDRTDGKLGGILPISAINYTLDVPANAAPVQPQQATFTLVNEAQMPVCFVFISPTTDTSWGSDQLGEQEIINNGASRDFVLPVDIYDVLLLDCDGNDLLESREIDLTGNQTLRYTGADATVDEPATPQNDQVAQGSGVSVTCDNGVAFNNGVEFIVRGMPVDETYTVTVVGLNGFDPVLAVLDNVTGDGTCADDSPGAIGYAVNLPTTGAAQTTELSSQLTFKQDSGVGFADMSVVVGGYGDSGGDFALIIEGLQLTPEDRGADLIAFNLTQGTVESGTPLTLYMAGSGGTVDALTYLADPDTFEVFVDSDGLFVTCDDASGSGCWGQNFTLPGSTLSIPGGAYSFSTTDSMLVIPLGGLTVDPNEPSYFTFGFSSFEQQSIGSYTVVFHAGIGS